MWFGQYCIWDIVAYFSLQLTCFTQRLWVTMSWESGLVPSRYSEHVRVLVSLRNCRYRRFSRYNKYWTIKMFGGSGKCSSRHERTTVMYILRLSRTVSQSSLNKTAQPDVSRWNTDIQTGHPDLKLLSCYFKWTTCRQNVQNSEMFLLPVCELWRLRLLQRRSTNGVYNG